MTGAIRPEIVKLLEAQGLTGGFASVDAVIETLALADAAAEADLAIADLVWAKPYVEKGLADMDAGRTRRGLTVRAELRAWNRAGA